MICPKCNNGLIPFVKNGKVISHAWVDCECKQPEQERYQSITPTDFDFPCSGAFRSHSYQYCNRPDPGYIPPEPEAPPTQVIEHRHSDMSKKDFARLNNLEGQVKYLQGKLTEKQGRKQRKYKRYENA